MGKIGMVNVTIGSGNINADYVNPVNMEKTHPIDVLPDGKSVEACWYNPVDCNALFLNFDRLGVEPGQDGDKDKVMLTFRGTTTAVLRIFIYYSTKD